MATGAILDCYFCMLDHHEGAFVAKDVPKVPNIDSDALSSF